ncbi:MAG: hypothetical protein A2878_00610 [Candidatus Moranbacteria bacterium RIFCSPHIGHO2_01_FULL_54_31]|nr:MAG: hypothetical protein A2878_00610 [Candidatus Moranbacteria bacterium RIFCSPHIGHO2_01_FULL_54_31]
MIFDGVNHIAIIASDLEKSLEFYRGILGLHELHRIERPERQSTVVYLDARNCIIELFSFSNPPSRLTYPEATGLRHLAFSVSKIDELANTLTSQGVDYEPFRKDPRTGKRVTFIFDPDKLPIEIVEV